MVKIKVVEDGKIKVIKKRVFVRPEWDKWKRIKNKKYSWRRPKGHQSKVRLKMKSTYLIPNVGYRNPRKIRGLHPSGLREILVYRPEDLDGVDPSRYVVRIASSVGKRKRIKILERAKKLGIKILNPRIR